MTGFADDKINSNDKNWNENITFLETLNNNASFEDKVAAFATWDVIPYIINEKRTNIPVNAGLEPIGEPNEKEKLINDIQRIYPSLARVIDMILLLTSRLKHILKRKNLVSYFFLLMKQMSSVTNQNMTNIYLRQIPSISLSMNFGITARITPNTKIKRPLF